jgi:hypothetical protein
MAVNSYLPAALSDLTLSWKPAPGIGCLLLYLRPVEFIHDLDLKKTQITMTKPCNSVQVKRIWGILQNCHFYCQPKTFLMMTSGPFLQREEDQGMLWFRTQHITMTSAKNLAFVLKRSSKNVTRSGLPGKENILSQTPVLPNTRSHVRPHSIPACMLFHTLFYVNSSRHLIWILQT